jgi:hypothetical protein
MHLNHACSLCWLMIQSIYGRACLRACLRACVICIVCMYAQRNEARHVSSARAYMMPDYDFELGHTYLLLVNYESMHKQSVPHACSPHDTCTMVMQAHACFAQESVVATQLESEAESPLTAISSEHGCMRKRSEVRMRVVDSERSTLGIEGPCSGIRTTIRLETTSCGQGRGPACIRRRPRTAGTCTAWFMCMARSHSTCANVHHKPMRQRCLYSSKGKSGDVIPINEFLLCPAWPLLIFHDTVGRGVCKHAHKQKAHAIKIEMRMREC